MADYKIQISTSDGTLSGSYNSGGATNLVNISVDRGATRSSTQRILSAKFGDGYEQRVLDGINTKVETFGVSFNNRSSSEINLISQFLDDGALTAFNFFIGSTSSIKVICKNYNISYSQDTVYSLSAQFERVYEA